MTRREKEQQLLKQLEELRGHITEIAPQWQPAPEPPAPAWLDGSLKHGEVDSNGKPLDLERAKVSSLYFQTNKAAIVRAMAKTEQLARERDEADATAAANKAFLDRRDTEQAIQNVTSREAEVRQVDITNKVVAEKHRIAAERNAVISTADTTDGGGATQEVK